MWRTSKSERENLINLKEQYLRKQKDNRYLKECNELYIQKEAQNSERARQLYAQEANRIGNIYGKIIFGLLSSKLDPGFQLLKYMINILDLIKYVSYLASDSVDVQYFL